MSRIGCAIAKILHELLCADNRRAYNMGPARRPDEGSANPTVEGGFRPCITAFRLAIHLKIGVILLLCIRPSETAFEYWIKLFRPCPYSQA